MRALYKPVEGQFYAYLYDPSGNLVSRHYIAAFNGKASVQDINFPEAYGSNRQRVNVFGSPPLDSVGFGGQYGNYTDTETGLVLMTHRYYDPGKGRFINRDPIGYNGGINLYGYAGGNPVNEIDPEGTAPGDSDDDGTDDLIKHLSVKQRVKDFKSDPEFAPGSQQRRDYSNFVNQLPGVGQAMSAHQALTGKDIVGGTTLSPGQRLIAVVVAGLTILHIAHGESEMPRPGNPAGKELFQRIASMPGTGQQKADALLAGAALIPNFHLFEVAEAPIGYRMFKGVPDVHGNFQILLIDLWKGRIFKMRNTAATLPSGATRHIINWSDPSVSEIVP